MQPEEPSVDVPPSEPVIEAEAERHLGNILIQVLKVFLVYKKLL